MYSPDTLERLNDERVKRERALVRHKEVTCDYCDRKAVKLLAVLNPADAVRNPQIKGAYSTISLCEECYESDAYRDDHFYCADCGRLFVCNHSWDVLAVTTDDGIFCQECAIRSFEPVTIAELVKQLNTGNTSLFLRVTNIPDKEVIYECEFSQYNDFLGKTSLGSIANDLLNLGASELVYPCITHTYQFSVALALYKA